MANKALTREQEYREILTKDGIRFEDCRVLAFVFERERQTEIFHYDLMLREPRPAYHLYDCFGVNANVIVPDDANNAANIIAMAEKIGGHKTTPNLR